ncbi:hypothetical protein PISMIDRAFT_59211, partial [Pisolithus microcarpus 441]
DTSRKTYGRLLQCRTRHAFLGEYHSTFVPTEDPSCPCGEPIQTRQHIITSCPTFENHRNILRTASEGLVISDLLERKKELR